MSDIFISYKREEPQIARKLADALESEGWTVWWDPKLRAGERFDDVIEKALNEAKCVIVIWSERSVQSRYVRDEATYALEKDKLVPVAIENVSLPFRFRGGHTLSLLAWDGSKDSLAFRRLVDDISTILRSSPIATAEGEERRKVEEEDFRVQERQRSDDEAKRNANEEKERRREQKIPSFWRKYIPVAAAVAVLLILFSYVFWWPKPQEAPVKNSEVQNNPIEGAPIVKPQPPKESVPAAPGKKSEALKEIITEINPKITMGALVGPRVFRDRLKSGDEGPEMVVIPAGSFKMGDVQGGGTKDEVPVHTVKIQKPFAIGRYEVTFEEYDQFATAANRQLPGDQGWGRGRRPVINVSWQDAVEYGKWLSGQTGKRYRLLTEAEWEYAARGGKETAYWWGKDFVKGMANCNGCGSQWDSKQTAPVGSFKPNPFGIYDTAGNVWEWVEDCAHLSYNGAPEDGSAWKQTGDGDCGPRVMRGGSWFSRSGVLRASGRNSFFAGERVSYV